MATGFVNGTGAIFNPHRIHTPSPITKKSVTNDYVGTSTAVPNFVQICPREASGRIGEI